MQEVRFADGLDTPDRIAFGLGAWQLLAVVGGVVLAYAMAHSPLPASVSAPLAATTAALTAALGWLRLAGRPLLEWSVFAVRFLAGARSGRLLIQNEPAGQPAVEMPVPPRASPAFRSVVVPLRPYVLEDAAETAAAPPARRAPRTLRAAGAHRIAFFSLKGGTGRTMLATEIGALLAMTAAARHRMRVALLDLDTRSPSVGVRLGVAHAGVMDFALAPPDARSVDRYLATHHSGLRVLTGPAEPVTAEWPLNADVVRELLRDLDVDGFDVVITDVAAELSAITTAVLLAADDVLVVLNPTASGVQDAYRTTRQLRRLGLRHQLRYVVNRARPGVDVATAMADLAGAVAAEIPEDPEVVAAEDRQRSVSETRCPASFALQRLARRIHNELTSAGRE